LVNTVSYTWASQLMPILDPWTGKSWVGHRFLPFLHLTSPTRLTTQCRLEWAPLSFAGICSSLFWGRRNHIFLIPDSVNGKPESRNRRSLRSIPCWSTWTSSLDYSMLFWEEMMAHRSELLDQSTVILLLAFLFGPTLLSHLDGRHRLKPLLPSVRQFLSLVSL